MRCMLLGSEIKSKLLYFPGVRCSDLGLEQQQRNRALADEV